MDSLSLYVRENLSRTEMILNTIEFHWTLCQSQHCASLASRTFHRSQRERHCSREPTSSGRCWPNIARYSSANYTVYMFWILQHAIKSAWPHFDHFWRKKSISSIYTDWSVHTFISREACPQAATVPSNRWSWWILIGKSILFPCCEVHSLSSYSCESHSQTIADP